MHIFNIQKVTQISKLNVRVWLRCTCICAVGTDVGTDVGANVGTDVGADVGVSVAFCRNHDFHPKRAWPLGLIEHIA